MFFRAVCLQHSPGDAGQSKVGRKYHATTPATCSESGPLINCLAWGFQHCPLQMKNKHSAALRRTNFCTSLEQKFLAIHRLSTLEAFVLLLYCNSLLYFVLSHHGLMHDFGSVRHFRRHTCWPTRKAGDKEIGKTLTESDHLACACNLPVNIACSGCT